MAPPPRATRSRAPAGSSAGRAPSTGPRGASRGPADRATSRSRAPTSSARAASRPARSARRPRDDEFEEEAEQGPVHEFGDEDEDEGPRRGPPADQRGGGGRGKPGARGGAERAKPTPEKDTPDGGLRKVLIQNNQGNAEFKFPVSDPLLLLSSASLSAGRLVTRLMKKSSLTLPIICPISSPVLRATRSAPQSTR